MPKNIKASSHQSSLKEMWGGKKKEKDTTVQPKTLKGVHEDDMDVDHANVQDRSVYCDLYFSQKLHDLWHAESVQGDKRDPETEHIVSDKSKSPKSE